MKEVIYRVRPDVIIETGGAHWLIDLLRQLVQDHGAATSHVSARSVDTALCLKSL